MYKMATACVPSGTILVVDLQKCSHLSNFFCIEFQALGKTTYPSSGWQIWMLPYTEGCNCFIIFLPMFYRLSPLWGKIGLFPGSEHFGQCFIGYLPCEGKLGCSAGNNRVVSWQRKFWQNISIILLLHD